MKKLQHQKYPERLGSITDSTAVGASSGVIMHDSLLYYSCLFSGPEPRGRAGYPPVAPKPSIVRMATGGAGPEEAGQGSPVVMKKMVPVQSSRPQSAALATMAQQGERQLGNKSLLVSLQ